MRLRPLVVFWPLILPPAAAIIIVAASGPFYDGGVNQNSIVIRFISMIGLLVMLAGGVVFTIAALKEKRTKEILVLICSALAGGTAAYLIATGINRLT